MSSKQKRKQQSRAYARSRRHSAHDQQVQLAHTPEKKLEYKWIIMAVSFLMLFTCLGFCSSNKGLYLGAITETLGIERSLFSLNDTFRFGIFLQRNKISCPVHWKMHHHPQGITAFC